MKFTINKKVFVDAVKNVSAIIGTRFSLSVLQNILIKSYSDKKEITLIADNLEQRVSVTAAADVETEGAVTLPAKKLLSIISKTNCSEISVVTNDKAQAELRCGTANVKMFGLPAHDFPDETSEEFIDRIDIAPNLLEHVIKHGGYSYSVNDARQVLQGMCLEIDGDRATVVSTDGKRLAVAHASLPSGNHTKHQYIIPNAAANLLSSLKNESITIHFGTKRLLATDGKTVVSTRLIEGSYPNWQQVIPATCRECVRINSEIFLSRIDLCSSMMSTTPSIELKFWGNKLIFEGNSEESGSIADVMEIENHVAQEYVFRFNPLYCQAVVKANDVPEFTFSFNDTSSPILFGFGDNSFAVIMPIRK